MQEEAEEKTVKGALWFLLQELYDTREILSVDQCYAYVMDDSFLGAFPLSKREQKALNNQSKHLGNLSAGVSNRAGTITNAGIGCE